MTKKLFAFVDANFKVLSKYEELGFKIEIDDPANDIYYVELDLSNYDMLNILVMLNECDENNLGVAVDIDGQLFNGKTDYDLIDKIVGENPLAV